MIISLNNPGGMLRTTFLTLSGRPGVSRCTGAMLSDDDCTN